MIFISNKGNLNGEDKLNENSPEHILKALRQGFDVKIDVWYVLNNLYLGDDCPQYNIDIIFLKIHRDNLICQAKNIEALIYLLKENIHCFYQNEKENKDSILLTNKGFIINREIEFINERSIFIFDEQNFEEDIKDEISLKCYGICTNSIYSLVSKLL